MYSPNAIQSRTRQGTKVVTVTFINGWVVRSFPWLGTSLDTNERVEHFHHPRLRSAFAAVMFHRYSSSASVSYLYFNQEIWVCRCILVSRALLELDVK
jgi:hypothetical protein